MKITLFFSCDLPSAFTPHKSMISDIAWLSKGHLLSATCPPFNQLAVLDVDTGEETWSKGRLHKGSVKVVARKQEEPGKLTLEKKNTNN